MHANSVKSKYCTCPNASSQKTTPRKNENNSTSPDGGNFSRLDAQPCFVLNVMPKVQERAWRARQFREKIKRQNQWKCQSGSAVLYSCDTSLACWLHLNSDYYRSVCPAWSHSRLRDKLSSSSNSWIKHTNTLRFCFRWHGLPASRFRDKWQIWDGKRKTCFSQSRIVMKLPVHKSFIPAGPKCDIFREGCDKKRHKLKKNVFVCESVTFFIEMWQMWRVTFLSPKKVTYVTSLTRIWDGKLARDSGQTDPYPEKDCIVLKSKLIRASPKPKNRSASIVAFFLSFLSGKYPTS